MDSLREPSTGEPPKEGKDDAFLASVAERVTRLGLQGPAIMLLEMHRPLNNVLHTMSLFVEPLLSPVFGSHRLHAVQRLLESPQNVDRLIAMIESYSLAQKGRNTNNKRSRTHSHAG